MNPAVEYVGRVLDDPATVLTTNARFVLAELARHWNRRSETAWPGVGGINEDGIRSGLMKTTGLSERTIQYAFREIETGGYAIPEARPGKSTVWRFPLETAADDVRGARGAPLHLVHPSVESRGARGAPRGARGAPGGARGAPEPLKEPVVRTRAPIVGDDAQPLRPGDVLRCPNLPPRRNAWCHADCPLCHGMGHVYAEQLEAL